MSHPKFCALLSQQSHLFLNDEVLTCNDSRKDLHTPCRIPRNCQCKCARGHITKRKDETIHTTTWMTHHQTPQHSTTQHSTSWRSATDAILPGHREHTGGSRQDTHGTPVLITIRRSWVAQPVKSIPPNTENWLRKLYDKNYNNDTSTEDEHETNYSMNNDTRNMHIT